MSPVALNIQGPAAVRGSTAVCRDCVFVCRSGSGVRGVECNAIQASGQGEVGQEHECGGSTSGIGRRLRA